MRCKHRSLGRFNHQECVGRSFAFDPNERLVTHGRSFMFDPKEGLVAPVTRNWGFGAANQVDGDQTEGLFCWDGSFASYMLSLDALDLSFSNLIQIIKMRTSAGFIPSYSAGTLKSRDRSNPPVTANILHHITQRWGAAKTQWVVELCFDVSCARTQAGG